MNVTKRFVTRCCSRPADKPARGYCFKTTIVLKKKSGEPTAHCHNWSSDVSSARRTATVAEQLAKQLDLDAGEIQMVFQYRCEHEVAEDVIVQFLDE